MDQGGECGKQKLNISLSKAFLFARHGNNPTMLSSTSAQFSLFHIAVRFEPKEIVNERGLMSRFQVHSVFQFRVDFVVNIATDGVA